MRRIINNKAYDTDTATMVAEYEYGWDRGNFKWWGEELYQKKNGEFFLHGEGNELSKYGYWIGNNAFRKNVIIPMTGDEAKKWVLEYANTHYEELFGMVEE